MRPFVRLVVGCLMFVPLLAKAQTSSDACRISAYWWSDQSKLGSGLMLLGQFTPQPGRESAIKTFNLGDSGLIVTVGVEYEYENISSEKPPTSIRLAIAVLPNEEKNLFGSTESAQAVTPYGKKWSSLSVSKKVKVEKLVWTVGLHCENSKGKSKRAKA